mgnify:FL=1
MAKDENATKAGIHNGTRGLACGCPHVEQDNLYGKGMFSIRAVTIDEVVAGLSPEQRRYEERCAEADARREAFWLEEEDEDTRDLEDQVETLLR